MNFKCPFLILAMLLIWYNSFSQNSENITKPTKAKFGIGVGAGISKFSLKETNWKSINNIYYDSLSKITSTSIARFDLILFYQISIKENIEIRPTFSLTFGDGGKIEYQRKIVNTQSIKIRTLPMSLSCPILLKLPSTKNRFYVNAGPSILYVVGQDDNVEKQIPIKSFDFLADLGFGFDIGFKKIFLTPEIKYAIGLTNLHKNNNNLYTNTLERINRQSLTLLLLLRDRL